MLLTCLQPYTTTETRVQKGENDAPLAQKKLV
ncbi:Uncharacterised protein [Serratia grimesii]|nr:Uncharacterised protein [Serratia grimesii]